VSAAARLHLGVDAPRVVLDLAPGGIALLPDDDRAVSALVGSRPRPPGQVALDGRRLDRRSPARRVRAGLATVSGVEVAGDLSVLDHLAAVTTRGAARQRLAGVPTLADRAADPAGVLSGGEQRLLGWLVAAATEPRVVVLDRAGTGLDAAALAWAHRTVDDWLDAGVAVVVRPGRAEEHRWVSHRADGSPR
jgi:branched-chain amino acid transport system ATP-binding protein